MLDKLEKILQNHNVFLSGGAGVGKSFLTNQLRQSYKNKGKNLIALGSSALSAFNVGGITLHSFFCLGRCENAEELRLLDLKQRKKLAKLFEVLKKLDLIIIDEISMVSASVFDMISMRIKNSLFKGKILVVGDFFQLPPVVKKEQNSLFVNSFYAFSSLFWDELAFKNVKLSAQKRTNDMGFYEHLSLLRKGKINDEILNYFEKFIIQKDELESLSDDFTLLCGINHRANEINEKKLARLESELFSFEAVVKKEDESLSDEALRIWVNGLNILGNLRLKIGARVIFCLNNFDKNYYNGEQGVIDDIIKFDDKMIIKITKSNNEQILLEPYNFLMEELAQNGSGIDINIRASVTQFPIKLAYAITIHKSQGMSIANLACDIDNIFENGQLYVALSRAINPKNLRIIYTKRQNFRQYFARILKIDENVCKFYTENKFLDLEENMGEKNEI